MKLVATDSAVTLMYTSLPQHCHFHCCHNAVLVFAATALCISVSHDRCGIPPVQVTILNGNGLTDHVLKSMQWFVSKKPIGKLSGR